MAARAGTCLWGRGAWPAAAMLLLGAASLGCADEEEELPWPYAPHEPPPIAEPVVDVPFVQETNHAIPELEPEVGALVAVLVAPPGSSDFEEPVQITPRGLLTHDGGGAPAVLAIHAGQPDLIDAAFAGDTLVLAGPQSLYVVDVAGQSVTAAPAPPGLSVNRLARGEQRIYVLTDHGLGLVHGPPSVQVEWPSGGSPSDGLSAAVEADGQLVVAGTGELRAYAAPPQLPLGSPAWTFGAAGGLASGSIAALVAEVTLPQPLALVVIGDEAVQGLALTEGSPALVEIPEFAADRVPLGAPTHAARAADGGFVVATEGGAYRMVERDVGPEWRVYSADRWLPDERVRSVATDDAVVDGPIYFATEGGLAWTTSERITLEDKLESFVERVVLRHDRDGAVADSRMTAPGDLSTSIPWDSDNDGGWTCYWLLAECFRHQVTGDPEAKAHFDKSLERMLSFRTLTGTEHFLARSVIRRDGCRLDDCDDPDDGEWFLSPDGAWWVKGDTSNDEVTSHMFMMGHAHDLCADADQRAAITAHVDGIVGGILDHGYQLIDVDGEVTKHGQFDPFYVNESIPGQLGDGGHRSVQLFAALSLAFYLTGDRRYLAAKHELIAEHHYDQNIVTESEYPFRAGSGDGDELVTQAFFILLRYEHDPALRERWLEGWRRSYGNMKLQQAALWDMVHAMVGGDDPDLFYAMRWLRLAPMDMIRWFMHNSHRRDLAPAPDYYEPDGRMRSDGLIIPYDERINERWNTDQFTVDGGWGPTYEMDGADVLMPYWLGRYYGFIEPS